MAIMHMDILDGGEWKAHFESAECPNCKGCGKVWVEREHNGGLVYGDPGTRRTGPDAETIEGTQAPDNVGL